MSELNPKRARSLAAFTAALPGTQQQIIKRSKLCRRTVVRLIAALRGNSIHIGEWLPHPANGPHIGVWMAGSGEDAPDTLPRMTRKEISARYESSLKGTDFFHVRRARQRSRYWQIKAAKAPNTWLAILGVRAGSMNAEG